MNYAISDGWRSLKCWKTQNLTVEVALNIEVLKIWWLKITKTLKNAKSDDSKYRKHRTTQNLRPEYAKELKDGKSDGWNYRKHRTTQNRMVEVAWNIEGLKILWLKFLKRWRTHNLIVEITENIELHKIWCLKSHKTLK